MADVQTVSAPTVQESGGPLGISAPASAFGATVAGQGLSDLGKTDQSTSDMLAAHAEQFQAVNNKVAADTATTSALPALDKLRADYVANNRGMAASANLGQFYKDAEQARQSFGQDLSPMAQVEYDSASRRYLAGVQGQITSFAVDERKKAVVGSSNAVIQTNQGIAASSPYGSEAFNNAIGNIAKEVAFQSRPDQLGYTPEEATARLHQEVGTVVQSQIKQSVDSGDILTAQGIFSDHKGDMTPEQINSVAGALKVGAGQFVDKGFAEDIFNGKAPTDRSALVGTASNAKNNNPGNVRALPNGQWEGQTGISTSGFAQFATPEAGNAAAVRNLQAYGSEHGIDTLAGVTQRWAPTGDGANNPAAYAATIAKTLGIGVNDKIDLTDPAVAQRVASAMYPVEQGHPVAQAQPKTYNVPPPTISPNEDPAKIRADYDAYIPAAANALYSDNPQRYASAVAAARNMISIKIQGVAAAQKTVFDSMTAAIDNGVNGQAIHSLSDLPATQLALLPADMVGALGMKINSAVAGYGGFRSPEMNSNNMSLRGLAMTDPATFADPSKTDLTKYNLSASDFNALSGMQRSIGNKVQAQTAQHDKLQSYLADPIVKNIYNNSANINGPEQSQEFLGALDGAISAAHRDGSKPTPQEIRSTAQSLVVSQNGSHAYEQVPAARSQQIIEAYKAAGLGVPSGWQIVQEYRSKFPRGEANSGGQ